MSAATAIKQTKIFISNLDTIKYCSRLTAYSISLAVSSNRHTALDFNDKTLNLKVGNSQLSHHARPVHFSTYSSIYQSYTHSLTVIVYSYCQSLFSFFFLKTSDRYVLKTMSDFFSRCPKNATLSHDV